jgi:hypothetical protein
MNRDHDPPAASSSHPTPRSGVASTRASLCLRALLAAAVLAALVVAAGCGGAELRRVYESPFPRLIACAYSPTIPPGTEQDVAYVHEASREGHMSKILELNLATGDAVQVAEFADPFLTHDGDVPCFNYAALVLGPRGRVARTRPLDDERRVIELLQPDGSWRIVVRVDKGYLGKLSWSPTGDELAYVHTRRMLTSYAWFDTDEGSQTDLSRACVVSVPDEHGSARVRVVATEPRGWHDIAWSPDGKALYVVSRPSDGDQTIEAVQWPSMERRVLATAGCISPIAVAADSGSVAWFAAGVEDGVSVTPVELWTASPGSDPEPTGMVLCKWPLAVALSPDGRHLALIPLLDGVMVWDLEQRTKQFVPEFSNQAVWRAQWALGGRSLLVETYDEEAPRSGVWLVPIAPER